MVVTQLHAFTLTDQLPKTIVDTVPKVETCGSENFMRQDSLIP